MSDELIGVFNGFVPDTITVTVRKRTFVLRELSGYDVTTAAKAADSNVNLPIGYFRVAQAIAEVNGVKIPRAKNTAELEGRLMQISGRELDALAVAYGNKFAGDDEDLKNVSTASDSQANTSPSDAVVTTTP